MIKQMKRLWKDRRGNALAIAGAALPLVVGAAGLATDTIQWVTWKRQLQRAADSAAFAGALSKAQKPSETADSAVTTDLNNNNHTPVTLLAGYPQIAYPTAAGWNSAVQVTLAVQKKLGFSSLFMANAPIIKTSATAALVDDGEYCVVALKKSGVALSIGGSASVRMGCGAISNSTDPHSSVDVNGTAHYFQADPVASAGGIDGTINGVTDQQPYHIPMRDPYAGKYSTEVPSGTNCTNFNHPTKTNSDGSLRPGCYNNFNPGNGTTVLSPGVYYLNNTNLSLSGQQRLVGNGVTIIMTGTSPGSISMNGSSSMALTAPTDATCGVFQNIDSCKYKNMLFIQSANATLGNDNLINGNNNTALDGAMYFPNGDISFTGSSAQATKCAMVVGYTVEFSGNTNIQNDTTGCNANTRVMGQTVRLVG
jgi:hypothetical protein